MTMKMKRLHQLGTGFALATAGLVGLFGAAPALAQEGGPPSPEDLKQKVLEIDRLMKQAEEALIRSLAERDAGKRTAEAIEKLLEQKAQDAAGKSAEQLRKEAEKGSAEAKETLQKLLTESQSEVSRMTAEQIRAIIEKAGGTSESAGESVRKMLEKIREQTQGAGEGIKWILENATTHSHQRQPPKEEPKGEPEGKEKGEEKPPQTVEPPKSPEGKRWFAQLPPQVRKAYETQDWDSIPPRWRSILRAWTIKMAAELDKGR